MITKLKRRFSADLRPNPYEHYARQWLLKELQTGPVWSERAEQLLEHSKQIERETTRAAIKDLIAQGKVRVIDTQAGFDYRPFELLELVRVAMPLDELRKEYNSIRRSLKTGSGDIEQLKARRRELDRIYRVHYKAQLKGTGKRKAIAVGGAQMCLA